MSHTKLGTEFMASCMLNKRSCCWSCIARLLVQLLAVFHECAMQDPQSPSLRDESLDGGHLDSGGLDRSQVYVTERHWGGASLSWPPWQQKETNLD